MILIGVVSEESNDYISCLLKSVLSKSGVRVGIAFNRSKKHIPLFDYIKLVSQEIDILIIRLTKVDLGLYKDVFFDIVILNSPKICDIEKNITQHSVLIFNSDNQGSEDNRYPTTPVSLITYGLSSKCTVTASSIEPDVSCFGFTYCLQRSISTLSGNIVVPQEFPVKISLLSETNIYTTLPVITAALIADITPVIKSFQYA